MGKCGFIGCGNMGSALIRSAVQSIPSRDVLVYDTDLKKSEALAEELNITVCDLPTLAVESDYIFIGVKPQSLAELSESLNPLLQQRTGDCVLVSMLAGKTINSLKDILKTKLPVIRIMPNLPCQTASGITLWCSEGTGEAQEKGFEALMSHSGALFYLKEELFNAGSAVSGCGPAFVAMFADCLAEAGAKCGLEYEDALVLSKSVIAGTIDLLDKKDIAPADLVKAVCSPGGTTIEGVKQLEEHGLSAALDDAVKAARDKALKL